MKQLIIDNKQITTLDEFKGLFSRKEIQDISSPLCYEIINDTVDGAVSSFLQDLGYDDLARQVRLINSDDTDPEIMEQLCAIFTDISRISFNVESCIEILQSYVTDTNVVVKIKIIKPIIAEVEVGVKQKSSVKTEILKLGEYGVNEEKELALPIDKDEAILLLLNKKVISEIKNDFKNSFSVSPTNKVIFSKGNLQYQASTNTWRFAERQWHVADRFDVKSSLENDDWIDLFGWGTSGYDDKTPCMESPIDSTYGNGNSDIAETNYDWGVYNIISNGLGKNWRTLTIDEWRYVLFARRTQSGVLFAKASVCGVNGIVLLPDNWDSTYYKLSRFNDGMAEFDSNVINQAAWFSMVEANGAVFLPAAGYWNGATHCNGFDGCYWSASCYFKEKAWSLRFCNRSLFEIEAYRSSGRSVRLVSTVK